MRVIALITLTVALSATNAYAFSPPVPPERIQHPEKKFRQIRTCLINAGGRVRKEEGQLEATVLFGKAAGDFYFGAGPRGFYAVSKQGITKIPHTLRDLPKRVPPLRQVEGSEHRTERAG